MPDVLILREEGRSSSPGLSDTVAELANTVSQLHDALNKFLLASRANRSQALQWLISALSALSVTDRATRRRRFAQFLPGGSAHAPGPAHDAFCTGLLCLLLEGEPARVAELLARQPRTLRRFFRGSPRRAAAWFGHFSMAGAHEFKHGARALANYAMAQRDTVWSALEWRGRHSQAPVAVAQRMHYFCELDVARTVANLERNCPEFWESEELRASLAGGDLLRLDPPAWAEELAAWLGERSVRGDALFALACDWLETRASWRALCARLLPLLPPQDLLRFADGLLAEGGYVSSSSRSGMAESTGAGAPRSGEGSPASALPAAWLVLRGVRWPSLDNLVLASAAGCSQGPLLRLLREEEAAEERARVLHLVRAMHAAPAAAHWQLRRQRLELLQAGDREAERGRRGAGAGVQPAPAAAELHRLLLLQLLAAGLAVQEAASSTELGSALQLQGLLAGSGVECEVATGCTRSTVAGAGSGERKKRRRRKSSSKKKRRREQQRRLESGRRCSEEDSGSSGGSDGEGGDGKAAAAADARWRLRWPGGTASSAVLSTFELCDAVMHHTAESYADWRFGRASERV